MSLGSLCEYTSVQNEAIGKLSSGLDSTTGRCARWSRFRDSLWGKGLESFQKEELVERDGVDPVEDVVLPEYHFVATLPETLPGFWGPNSEQILVRSEYNEAERAAVSSNESGADVFVVSGQPGNGNSALLLWLLMCRLALELPTALQVDSSYAILFHKGGVSEFTQLGDHLSYSALYPPRGSGSRSSRIWVLVDSDPALFEPAIIFRDHSPFFIVDAMSPHPDYLKWPKPLNKHNFYMKPWSISEVLQARPFLGANRTERQLWYLHNEFGASPRDLAMYADEPDVYESILHQEINRVCLGHLQDIFLDPGSHASSRYIITIEPSPTRRFSSNTRVASRRVFELLWKKRIKHRVDDMVFFYGLFRANPITAAAAGWVFELQMHRLLRKRRDIQLFPICGRRVDMNLLYDDYTASEKGTNPTSLQLTGSGKKPLVEGGRILMNQYYRPTNLPTIDSLILVRPPNTPPTLLMFHITQDESKFDVDIGSLDKVDGLKFPPNTRRYHVVVTPKGIQPKITVSVEYFGKKGWRKIPANELFPVYHYSVDRDALFPRYA